MAKKPIKAALRAAEIEPEVDEKNKPILIKVGNHYIEPSDVGTISKCRDRMDDDEGVRYSLYIVKLKSNPNPEFPIWVRGDKAINKLLEYFHIVDEE